MTILDKIMVISLFGLIICTGYVVVWGMFEHTELGKAILKKVKLIRCKDCKYNNGGRCGWHGGAGYKWVVDDDDFCSCGERRTE